MPVLRTSVSATVGVLFTLLTVPYAVASPDEAVLSASPFADFMNDARVGIELGMENFRWQEFDSKGVRLLSEHGPRYGFGGLLDNLGRETPGVLAVFSARHYRGRVEYDGQDSMQGRFLATNSIYGGYEVEAGGGYRFMPYPQTSAIDFLAGVGIDRWQRSIRSGINAQGSQVFGYTETYTSVHARLGAGVFLWEGMAPSYLSAGLRQPLYMQESLTLGRQSLVLKPERHFSAYASYQISLAPTRDNRPFGRFLRFSYDSYRLGSSPAITRGNQQIWQPESRMDAFGVSIGATFY